MGRRADGVVFFFADSEPVGSKDESPAGQVYEDATAELKPVQRRMLIPLTTVLLLLVVGFSALLTTQHRDHQRQISKNVLSESVEELDETLEEQSTMLAAYEDAILRDEGLRHALAAGDTERLLVDYLPLYKKLRQKHSITNFFFHGPDRTNLLRVNKPEKNGDLIDRFTVREAERTGKTVSGIELGKQMKRLMSGRERRVLEPEKGN